MSNNSKLDCRELPTLALRGLVAFPSMLLTLDVGRKKSMAALALAMDTDRYIFLVTQTDITVEDPQKKDLYKIGCICKVRQLLKTADGCKALVEGVKRAKLISLNTDGSYLTGYIEECEETSLGNRKVLKESLLRNIRSAFAAYSEVGAPVPKDVALTVAKCNEVPFLCDYIAFNIPAPFDDKQYVLEQLSASKRAKILIEMLNKEAEICRIDNKIGEKTRRRLDDAQKDYYLKEQIKVISEELYGDDSAEEIDRFHTAAEALNVDVSIKERLHTEINKLSKMPPGSHDGAVLKNWLEFCLSLPFNKFDEIKTDVNKASKILERDFYGMKKVKERILEMLSVYALSPDITGQIICLYGPPGVGKTSIGKTIAECMGRHFERVSLGGMHDEAEIRGHRKTYVGAMQGRIMAAIKRSECANPLILLDEIDKLANDYKGDPASALLEVLDPEQNKAFCDNFVEFPFDLSKAVFITTANSLDTIPAPLLDRMEVISLDGYTREEKFNIAKRHLIAKQLKSHALTNKQCKIADDTIYGLIDFYTREAGVRKLERAIASLCRKAAKKIASGEAKSVTIKASMLEELLGKHKYRIEAILPQDEVGIINGLAWTAVGGEIMQLEVAVLEGTGKTVLTGSLGDVMKESAEAAITFVRMNAEKYGIDPFFYKTKDIHIHATEAAVPKDGPSAGITIATALVSALSSRKIRRDIAMTGEITIRGRVLAIGGLKEKTMAAYKGGVKTVFIPYDNIADIDEIDETVKNALEIIPVSFADEVISRAYSEQLEEKKVTFTVNDTVKATATQRN